MAGARRIRIVLILALFAAGAGLMWAQGVWPHIAPKNFGVVHVDENRQLYRSGELTVAATAKLVDRYGIRTIVDLGTHEPGSRDDRIAQKTADALGVRRVRLDLEGDATGDPNDYVTALRIMTDPAAQPVLVHCGAGAERTGCLVALYRQIEQGWDADLAYRETKRHGHSGARNPRLDAVLDFWGDDVVRAFATGEPIIYEPEEFLRFEEARRNEPAHEAPTEPAEAAEASSADDAPGGM